MEGRDTPTIGSFLQETRKTINNDTAINNFKEKNFIMTDLSVQINSFFYYKRLGKDKRSETVS